MTTTLHYYVDTDTVSESRDGSKDNPYNSIKEASTEITELDLPSTDQIVQIHCKGNQADAYDTYVSFSTVAGWATDPTHYIEVIADKTGDWAGRHNGIPGTGYHIRLDSTNAFNLITVGSIRFTGLDLSTTSDGHQVIRIPTGEANGEVYISECILQGLKGTTRSLLDINSASNSGTLYFYNNMGYSAGRETYEGLLYIRDVTAYIFNNTLCYSFAHGITNASSGTITAINNIVQDCDGTNYEGTYAAGSGYNISDTSDTTGAGTDIANTTIDFVGYPLNDASDILDLHVISQTGTIRAGQNLSTHANLPFNTDIDSDTRGVGSSIEWDIGADHASIQNCYVDTDHTGGTEIGTKDNPYHSLQGWETDYGTAAGIDLVAESRKMIVRCKGSKIDLITGAISIPVSWSWVTDTDHYIEIRADKTGDWAGRHKGVSGTGYHITSTTAPFSSITIGSIRFIGLEVSSTNAGSPGIYVSVDSSEDGGEIFVHDCLIHGIKGITGIPLYLVVQDNSNSFIYNNIVYDGYNSIYAGLIQVSGGNLTCIYNNTVTDSFKLGIRTTSSNAIAINNIVQNCEGDAFYGTYNTELSGYNLSDQTDTTGSSTDITEVSLKFKNYYPNPSNYPDPSSQYIPDFHLSIDDTAAIGAGQNLIHDQFLPFDTDIDSNPRYGNNPSQDAWDIGADQFTPSPPRLVLVTHSANG